MQMLAVVMVRTVEGLGQVNMCHEGCFLLFNLDMLTLTFAVYMNSNTDS